MVDSEIEFERTRENLKAKILENLGDSLNCALELMFENSEHPCFITVNKIIEKYYIYVCQKLVIN